MGREFGGGLAAGDKGAPAAPASSSPHCILARTAGVVGGNGEGNGYGLAAEDKGAPAAPAISPATLTTPVLPPAPLPTAFWLVQREW